MINEIRSFIYPFNNPEYEAQFGSTEQVRFAIGYCQPRVVGRGREDQFSEPGQAGKNLHTRIATHLAAENFVTFDRCFNRVVDECRYYYGLLRSDSIERRWGKWFGSYIQQADQWLSDYDAVSGLQPDYGGTLDRCDALLGQVDKPSNFCSYKNITKWHGRRACSILLAEMSIEEMHKAISDIKNGEIIASERLLSLLKGICDAGEEVEKLQEEMLDKSELCSGFPVEQMYRLFIDENDWQACGLKLFCYEDEPGYAAGMLKAFRNVGGILARGALDLSKITKIHQLVTSGVLSSKENIAIGDISRDASMCVLKTADGVSLSEKGTVEIQALASQNGYPKIEVEGVKGHRVTTIFDHNNHKGYDLAENFCRIFEAELTEIKNSVIDSQQRQDAILASIAELCRNLLFTHPFRDGNARTIGCILVNGLLMREGLSPSLIDNANRFGGHSVGELVDVIKRGQSEFKRFRFQGGFGHS